MNALEKAGALTQIPKAAESSCPFIKTIPSDTVALILPLLNSNDIVSLSSTCHSLKLLTTSEIEKIIWNKVTTFTEFFLSLMKKKHLKKSRQFKNIEELNNNTIQILNNNNFKLINKLFSINQITKDTLQRVKKNTLFCTRKAIWVHFGKNSSEIYKCVGQLDHDLFGIDHYLMNKEGKIVLYEPFLNTLDKQILKHSDDTLIFCEPTPDLTLSPKKNTPALLSNFDKLLKEFSAIAEFIQKVL